MSTDPLAFDTLGAFCRANHATLAPTGHGVLDGLRFAAKDVFHIAGERTGFGNPDWLRTHAVETRTAPVIEKLRAAGADMIGRTLCDELTYSLSGENHHYGTPINPAAPGRIPGGSSNGSASATAGGLVDFAIGTDCAGSVRIPASYCGIFGLRPTHDRLAPVEVLPFAPTFDVIGWFTRDAALLERVGTVLFDEAPRAPRVLRLLRASDAFAEVDTEITAALEPAIARLAARHGALTEITVAAEGLNDWFEVFRTVQGAEIWGNRREWMESVRPLIGPGIRERLEWAATITPEMAARAGERHVAISAYLSGLLAPGDVLCLPTSPRIAPLCGTATHTLEVEYRAQAMRLLCIAGLGGLPQVSLPIARHQGLPLGLSLVGARGEDMLLLALARDLIESNPDLVTAV